MFRLHDWELISPIFRNYNHVTTPWISQADQCKISTWPVEVRKKYFYRDRYNELKESRLTSLAASLSASFSGRQALDEYQLEQLLHKAALPPGMTPEEAETILHDLGYIWQGDHNNESNWIPGTPSLMKYIEQRVTQTE